MEKVLIGAGGSAREIKQQMELENIKFFVDDKYWQNNSDNIYPLSKFDPEKYQCLITLGNPEERFNITKRMPSNTKYFSFVHHTALVMDSNVEIGIGSFIGAYSILTTKIKIGKHSILNRANHIGHDSTCGDFLSMMPMSVISGNCNIGNSFYIGTNSSVREKIIVCDNVSIGLNSGVVKDIDISGTYAGSPVKKIK